MAIYTEQIKITHTVTRFRKKIFFLLTSHLREAYSRPQGLFLLHQELNQTLAHSTWNVDRATLLLFYCFFIRSTMTSGFTSPWPGLSSDCWTLSITLLSLWLLIYFARPVPTARYTKPPLNLCLVLLVMKGFARVQRLMIQRQQLSFDSWWIWIYNEKSLRLG